MRAACLMPYPARRSLEAAKTAQEAQEAAVQAAVAAAEERAAERLRLAGEEAKMAQELAVAVAVAGAEERFAVAHEGEIARLTEGDDEAAKMMIAAAVSAAVERVRVEAERESLRRVGEARAEARAEAFERITAEYEAQLEEVGSKAAAQAKAVAEERAVMERDAAVAAAVRECAERAAADNMEAIDKAARMLDKEVAAAAAQARMEAAKEAAVERERAMGALRRKMREDAEKRTADAVASAVAVASADHTAELAEVARTAASKASADLAGLLEQKHRSPAADSALGELCQAAAEEARREAGEGHAADLRAATASMKTTLASKVAEIEAEMRIKIAAAEEAGAKRMAETLGLKTAEPSDEPRSSKGIVSAAKLSELIENARREATFVAEAAAEGQLAEAMAELAEANEELTSVKAALTEAKAQLAEAEARPAAVTGSAELGDAGVNAVGEALLAQLRMEVDEITAQRDALVAAAQPREGAGGEADAAGGELESRDDSGLLLVVVRTGQASATVEWCQRATGEDGLPEGPKPEMYELQWRSEPPDGTGPGKSQWCASEGSKTLKVLSATKRNLSPNCLYRFRVRAKMPDGDWLPFTMPSSAVKPEGIEESEEEEDDDE